MVRKFSSAKVSSWKMNQKKVRTHTRYVKLRMTKEIEFTGGHLSFVWISLINSRTGWPRPIFTSVLILLLRESAGRSWRVARRRSPAPV
jgi:hypothetical protein